MLILFMVDLDLHEGQVVGLCVATGKFDIVWYDQW